VHEYLDIYCERTAPGLWQEPLNTLTNLGFLIAAALLLRLYLRVYRGRQAQGWDRLLLIILLAAIGVGSGLWHLTAERWAMLADVLPIAGFISVFLLVFLLRIAGLGFLPALSLFLLYHAVNWGVQASLPPDFLNGSVFYLPTWMALVVMTFWLALKGHAQWQSYAWASGLFLVSLSLRTGDQAWCDTLPMGTHFIWHLLNALLLYLLVRALLQATMLRFR
jgi:hypothetical protein